MAVKATRNVWQPAEMRISTTKSMPLPKLHSLVSGPSWPWSSGSLKTWMPRKSLSWKTTHVSPFEAQQRHLKPVDPSDHCNDSNNLASLSGCMAQPFEASHRWTWRRLRTRKVLSPELWASIFWEIRSIWNTPVTNVYICIYCIFHMVISCS